MLKAIKFFNPSHPEDACIIDLIDISVDEMELIAQVQADLGRTELKFLRELKK